MRKCVSIEKLKRKLLWNGLPPSLVSKTLRELTEHWEDLLEEGKEKGLSAREAEEFADQNLGDTETLTAFITEQMQGNNWFGRHQLVTFCLFPLVAIVLWWVVYSLTCGWATGAWQWSNDKSQPQPNWELLVKLFQWGETGAAVILPVMFCWAASRSRAGFKPATLACLLLAIHHAYYFINLQPPGTAGAGFSAGYAFSSDLLKLNIAGFFIPLLILTLFVCLNFRNARENALETESGERRTLENFDAAA